MAPPIGFWPRTQDAGAEEFESPHLHQQQPRSAATTSLMAWTRPVSTCW
jgi:hypothetical protein